MKAGVMIAPGRGVRAHAVVADNFDGGQRVRSHQIADGVHCVVRRSDATHGRMLRTRQMSRVGPSRMDADAWMTGHVEANNAM